MRNQVALIATVALALCVAIISVATWTSSSLEEREVELESRAVATWFLPLAPIQATDGLYVYWGEGLDKYASAKVVRSALRLNHAPEYINSFTGQRFRGLSLDCCAVMVFPPFAHGFPVHNPHGAIARRIQRFIAQGNTAVFTGGVTDLLFLNQYFELHLEPLDNYAAGPFVRRYDRIPAALKMLPLPSKLNQVNVQATAVSRASLPYGSVILYDDLQAGAPVFMLKYCMVNNPKVGEPPFKVNPASCDRWKKKKNPCGCGNIAYIGFNYRDQNEKEWNVLLRELVAFSMHPTSPKPVQLKSKAANAAARPVAKRVTRGRSLAKQIRKPEEQKKKSRKMKLSQTDRDWEVIVHQGAVKLGKQSSIIEVKTKK